MPAHRKRPDLKQDNRASRRGLEVVVTSSDEVVAPPVPAGTKWLKRTQQAWDVFWTSSSAKLVEPAEIELVVRYFDYADMRTRAAATYRKEPFVEGSTGQPRSNPAFDQMVKFESMMTTIEDRLGYSPSARVKLGATIVQGKMTVEQLNRLTATPDGEHDGRSTDDSEVYEAWDEA